MQWFDNRPLWGQTVIVTRAREQASSLVSGLARTGARVIQCPTIRVANLDDYSALRSTVPHIRKFDWVVFTSTNGVEKFFQQLEGDARIFARTKIAAIGPATVDALKNHGLRADFMPESSISESVAEGLIENSNPDDIFLIIRAMESREVLETKLRAAGARLKFCPSIKPCPIIRKQIWQKPKSKPGA